MHDLSYYLNLPYEYRVVPDDGAFFVEYPDLPGCMTQVDDPADIPTMAQEIKELWLETAVEEGFDIPEPVTNEYSGKLLLRMPKSLHATLVHRAEQEAVSLNTYVLAQLSERSAANALGAELAKQITAMQEQMTAMTSQQTYRVSAQDDSDTQSTKRDRHGLRLLEMAV